MNKEYLPIGSVVRLENGQKSIMIMGIGIKFEDDNKMYDYIGVPYPEGYIDDETMFLFNHSDINEVEFIGYVNLEMQDCLNKLKQETEE